MQLMSNDVHKIIAVCCFMHYFTHCNFQAWLKSVDSGLPFLPPDHEWPNKLNS